MLSLGPSFPFLVEAEQYANIIKFYCMYLFHFAHLFIYRWTFGLFPVFNYYE